MNRRLRWWLRPCHPRLARQDLIIESFSFCIFGAFLFLPDRHLCFITWHHQKVHYFCHICLPTRRKSKICAIFLLFISVHHLVSHVTPASWLQKVLGAFLTIDHATSRDFTYCIPKVYTRENFPSFDHSWQNYVVSKNLREITWPRGHDTSRFQIHPQTSWYSKPLECTIFYYLYVISLAYTEQRKSRPKAKLRLTMCTVHILTAFYSFQLSVWAENEVLADTIRRFRISLSGRTNSETLLLIEKITN